MNIYYKNEKAILSASQPVVGSSLLNIYDPMLELRTDFSGELVTINGMYEENIAAIDSLCIGYTNASLYELTINEEKFSGRINDKITVFNFNEMLYTDSFQLKLEGINNLYLGLLFLGKKIVLPRFEVGPEISKTLNSESSRSFGGQVFGMRRKTLKSFAANFPRIKSYEKEIIDEYVETVLNIEPHIIDPYPEARDRFPPMYATLNTNEVSMKKLNEPGFFYSGSLSWKEAR